MRILLASSFHYPRGGDSIQFLDAIEGLAARRHETAVFSMHHPMNQPSPWSRYWLPRVEYRGAMSAKAKLQAACQSTYSIAARRRFTSLAKCFRPDIVHFHAVQPHLTVSVVDAAVALQLPVVWTLHDYRTVCPASALLRTEGACELCRGGRYWHCIAHRCKSASLDRSFAAVWESYATRWRGTLAKVDCYIAPSRFLAAKAIGMGLPARRIEVLPNPVGARVVEGPSGRAGVLFVGRLSPEKGIDLLVRACAMDPAIPLRIMGDGPAGADLKQLAQDLGGDVHFDGWGAPSLVADAMSRSALLCVPSVCYENCPGVVLEAMSAGLPVAASRIGGLSELLAEGRCGVLFEPGDVAGLRAALVEVLASQSKLAGYAELARQRVAARHSEPGFYMRLESIYRSLA